MTVEIDFTSFEEAIAAARADHRFTVSVANFALEALLAAARALPAEIRAREEAERSVLQIRPLEWREWSTAAHDHGEGLWEAFGPGNRRIQVLDCGDRFGKFRFYSRDVGESFETVEEAKAAAEARYEQDVRFYIIQRPATAAEQRVKALEEALAKRDATLAKAATALGPFADAVFNDNGDITVNLAPPVKAEDYEAAYWAKKRARATLEEK